MVPVSGGGGGEKGAVLRKTKGGGKGAMLSLLMRRGEVASAIFIFDVPGGRRTRRGGEKGVAPSLFLH